MMNWLNCCGSADTPRHRSITRAQTGDKFSSEKTNPPQSYLVKFFNHPVTSAAGGASLASGATVCTIGGVATATGKTVGIAGAIAVGTTPFIVMASVGGGGAALLLACSVSYCWSNSVASVSAVSEPFLARHPPRVTGVSTYDDNEISFTDTDFSATEKIYSSTDGHSGLMTIEFSDEASSNED